MKVYVINSHLAQGEAYTTEELAHSKVMPLLPLC